MTTTSAFGRGDIAKKAPESHLDVDELNTPEGLDRGIAMTDAVRRYHAKKAKHGAYATLAGGAVAGAGGLSLYKLPRAGMAAAVGGGALALGGLTHMQHHAVRADVARHNEAVMIGAKRQRAAVEAMAGAKPVAPTPTKFVASKGVLMRPEENTRNQNIAYGTAAGVVGGGLLGHHMDRRGLGIGRKFVTEDTPVKGFGRTTKLIARVSPAAAAKGVVLGDKIAFHGKTPAVFAAGAGVLGAASGAMERHRKKIAKYKLPGDNPQAEAARERKKSGLGLAGVGYLVASRHKDVTPGAVDLMTLPAKKGADAAKTLERAAKIERRTKAINTLSSRGGAGAVGLGLLMAGEGLSSDWRHRKVVQRAKGKVESHMAAYRAHQEDSLIKSAFGLGQIDKGLPTDPGLRQVRRAGKMMARLRQNGPADPSEWMRVSRHLDRVHAAGRAKAAAGVTDADKLAVLSDAYNDAHRVGGHPGGPIIAHDERNAMYRPGQKPRFGWDLPERKPMAPPGTVRKSAFGAGQIDKAFDPERQRHRRHELYEGGAAGGAVVAGAGAGVLGARALKDRQNATIHLANAVKTHKDLQTQLHDAAQLKVAGSDPDVARKFSRAGRLHLIEGGHGESALRYAARARKFGAGAAGAGLGAAGLAGAAIGIHRHDTAGHGRGY